MSVESGFNAAGNSESSATGGGSSTPGPGLSTEAQHMLDTFWSRALDDIKNLNNNDFKNQELPLARIKKIMKLDDDVKVMMISAEAPVLFAKAAEIFITEISLRAWVHTEDNKRRTLQRNDIAMAITKYDQFDFLIDIVPRDELKPNNPKRPQQPGGVIGGVGSMNIDQMNTSIPGNAVPADQVQYYLQLAQQTQQALQQQGIPQQTAAAAQGQQIQILQTPQNQMMQAGATQMIQIPGPNGQLQYVQIQMPGTISGQGTPATATGAMSGPVGEGGSVANNNGDQQSPNNQAAQILQLAAASVQQQQQQQQQQVAASSPSAGGQIQAVVSSNGDVQQTIHLTQAQIQQMLRMQLQGNAGQSPIILQAASTMSQQQQQQQTGAQYQLSTASGQQFLTLGGTAAATIQEQMDDDQTADQTTQD